MTLHQLPDPYTVSLPKGREFSWEDAFAQLRAALTTAPILALPDPGLSFIVDTDASDVGLGAVLSPGGAGGERVVAHYSRSLSRPEHLYCVTRRDLLPAVEAFKHFRPYLYYQRFLLWMDHASLTWLLSFKEPEGQVARWIEALQDYDFEVQHRAGRLHSNADALSRRPCDDCRHCERPEERYGATLQVAATGQVGPDEGWLTAMED